MQKKVNQQIKYYFSERLEGHLEQISHHPLTIGRLHPVLERQRLSENI